MKTSQIFMSETQQ